MSTGVSGVTRVIVVGAGGRMGARACALALESEQFALVGAVERAGSAHVGQPVGKVPITGPATRPGRGAADVVIDFSSPAGMQVAVESARIACCSLLVCTTGLGSDAVETLRAESKARAVLLSPNTSLGIAAVADLVRRCAAMLPGYECSVVEAHHSQKKDAPSGTALRLADAARAGGTGLKPEQIVSIRGGDVVGEHTVRFAGPGEYVELTHRATSRDLFARGALAAAAWLKGRGPGWWTMEDVLGLASR